MVIIFQTNFFAHFTTRAIAWRYMALPMSGYVVGAYIDHQEVERLSLFRYGFQLIGI